MNILVTGANGYIGTRLIPKLVSMGHKVFALVRDPQRFHLPEEHGDRVQIVRGDLLLEPPVLPPDIDAAYYLVHSMSRDPVRFSLHDRTAARKFLQSIENTQCKQIIYLSGLSGKERTSQHLTSRQEVERLLSKGKIPLTTLRASIIIGSGSASFEIIRDLVEKLPVMVAPRWIRSKCQPIAIADVIDYLVCVLGDSRSYGHTFDIGGPKVMSYKEALLEFAKARGLKRSIISIPLLTPRLSSYWLVFITSTNFSLARALIDSLKTDSICQDHSIDKLYPKKCLSYQQALARAFDKIDQNAVVSTWKDAWNSSNLPTGYATAIQMPQFGCMKDQMLFPFKKDPDKVLRSMFQLGGKRGYGMDWAWRLRGYIDRLIGGVGLRRGKIARVKPLPGEALDFWRVLLADEKQRRFLLYAEMRLPGEAWLEFQIIPYKKAYALQQTATFRPRGVLGRLYWYLLAPFHHVVFRSMGKKILEESV